MLDFNLVPQRRFFSPEEMRLCRELEEAEFDVEREEEPAPPIGNERAPEPSSSLVPNKTDITRHLYALFQPAFAQGYPDARIEIAWSNPDDGELDKARTFPVFAIEQAAEFAERQNRAHLNIYVGAALRKAGTTGRANGASVVTASHAWDDFDDHGDLDRVDTMLKEKDLQTSMTVVTGTVPHTRFQPYFQLAEAPTCEQLRAANTSLRDLLGGDAVQNPDRVMRLAGTINYPTPDKIARGYIPELTTLHLRRNTPAYRVAYLIDLAGKAERPEPAPYVTASTEPVSDERKAAYGQAALADITSELAAIPNGARRNNGAYLAGLKVGSLIAGGCLSEGEGYSRLVEACQQGWGKPTDRAYGPRGAIMNGIRNGMKNPKGPRDYDSYDFSVLLAQRTDQKDDQKRYYDPETGEVFEELTDESELGPQPEEPEPQPDEERVANEAPVAAQLPTIFISKRLSKTTDHAQIVLINAGVPFYHRGGELVRPIIRAAKAAHGHMTRTAQLKPVSTAFMRDTMCRHAHWKKFDARAKDYVPALVPSEVAETLLARDGVWKFREIVGVIACPTMRRDGTLLIKQGYDKATRLLMIEPPPMPDIPERPTREDALTALALLEELVSESPFENEASKSVALSGMISPVVRGAMAVVPLHVASAPMAGTGKSFLWDLAAAISIGQRRIPVIAAGNEEETEKRLGGVILTGQPLSSIDNVNGELKGEFLAQAIEQHFLDIRPLGGSKIVKVEAGGITIYATGNNIIIVGADLVRRTITARLDSNLEMPQLRQFKQDPIGMILSDRGKYIAACLTICRAYVVAERPAVLPRLASFEEWSDTVRSALVWLGKADPLDTMETQQADDPERELLSEMLRAWAQSLGTGVGAAVPLAKVAEMAGSMRLTKSSGYQPEFPELHEAFRKATETVSNAKIDLAKFGLWCRSNKAKPVGGMRLMNKPNNNGPMKWWIERK